MLGRVQDLYKYQIHTLSLLNPAVPSPMLAAAAPTVGPDGRAGMWSLGNNRASRRKACTRRRGCICVRRRHAHPARPVRAKRTRGCMRGSLVTLQRALQMLNFTQHTPGDNTRGVDTSRPDSIV